jgi:hypothetical protein
MAVKRSGIGLSLAAALLSVCLAVPLSLAVSPAALAATTPAAPAKKPAGKAAAKPAVPKAQKPAPVANVSAPVSAATIQNVRVIPDPAEVERLRDREAALDKQHAQMLMAVSMANDAAQRAAASADRLLVPLWIFALGSLAACLLLIWNLAESRKTTRSARQSVKELARIEKESQFSPPKSQGAAKPPKLTPTLDRPDAAEASVGDG